MSVVVPVYKVEPYIDKCLSSLVLEDASVMESLEVILVNDGTPDNSAEKSRVFVNRYPGTFRQIDKENGGHGSAWNVGLREAKGKYLRFLDSDDWFSNLDRLMADLEKRDEDVIFNPYVKQLIYEERTIEVGLPVSSGVSVSIDPGKWGMAFDGYLSVNFWSSTYKTSILKPLLPLFAEKTMYDDFILTWAPLVHGRRCYGLDYPVYNYLIGRPGQSMNLTHRRKGAESYKKCFEHYESVRSRIPEDSVPVGFLKGIDAAITGYASFVFSYIPFLPFRMARSYMRYLWEDYLKEYPGKSKLAVRYGKMPFFLFFIVERARVLKNRICKSC